MAADPRIHKILDYVEEMISLLEDIKVDMMNREEKENDETKPDEKKINFYRSQYERAESAIDILESDLITILIGLNNLSGPIKYMNEEKND